VSPFQRPEPFVSFIVPVKNEAKLIGQCLDAINNLDYDKSRYECIIVDNGSIDDTVKIAEQRGAKVLNLPNVTISALRNRGARDARGNYLAFIDADCVIDPNWLKQALPHFENPKIGCAGCHPSIPKDSTWVQRTWRLQTSRPAAIEEVDWLPSMNMLVKREAFIECGGFNESMITCEDVDFCYRLTRHWKVISDNNIAAIHFGEATTIQEFFRKERWRGQSSLQGLLSHELRWEEVPSLLLPVYYLVALVSLPLTILSFVVGFYIPLAINVIAIFVPALFLSIRTVSRAISKRIDFCQLLQLMFLYVLYSLARTAAVLPGKVGGTTSVILAKNPR
jgi:glycosyltransferase involved in cell wall biosynthesis